MKVRGSIIAGEIIEEWNREKYYRNLVKQRKAKETENEDTRDIKKNGQGNILQANETKN